MKPKTIAVVDDEKIVLEIAESMLVHLGFKVVPFLHSWAALNDICANEAIDLVLLDIRMKDMDGIELFQRIRRVRPNLPIIFVSGYDPASYCFRELSGPRWFLQKPYDIQSLLAIVSEALDDSVAKGQKCQQKRK